MAISVVAQHKTNLMFYSCKAMSRRSYFSGTVHIDRKGYSLLHIDKYDEDYLITMPKLHVEGIMTGSLCPDSAAPRTYGAARAIQRR